MNNLLKTLDNFYYRVKLLFQIDNLEIEETGNDEQGIYVKLKNGKYFYGTPTRQKQQKYYYFLPKRLKEKIQFSSFQTVYDIIIRYIERGLRLGGPKKEMYYTIKKGDVIAEMGAFMGYYTMYLSEKVGTSGKIVAIEPIPDNIEFLEKNIKKNNLKNVTIIPKGVWKEKSKSTFFKKQDDHQSASLVLNTENKNKFVVDVDSLDNILFNANVNHVDFMIIQLNGVEYEALEGLTKIKPKNISIAARYNNDNVKTSEKIKVLLEQRNYDVKIVEKDYVFASLKN